jgi:hypothetical protein
VGHERRPDPAPDHLARDAVDGLVGLDGVEVRRHRLGHENAARVELVEALQAVDVPLADDAAQASRPRTTGRCRTSWRRMRRIASEIGWFGPTTTITVVM